MYSSTLSFYSNVGVNTDTRISMLMINFLVSRLAMGQLKTTDKGSADRNEVWRQRGYRRFNWRWKWWTGGGCATLLRNKARGRPSVCLHVWRKCKFLWNFYQILHLILAAYSFKRITIYLYLSETVVRVTVIKVWITCFVTSSWWKTHL